MEIAAEESKGSSWHPQLVDSGNEVENLRSEIKFLKDELKRLE